MKLKTIFCAGILAISSSTFSNNKGVEECVKIEDPSLRIKCYDSIFLPTTPEEEKASIPSMKKAKNLWYTKGKNRKLDKNGYWGTHLYEANIPPMLRMFHIRKISPSGWVELPKSKKSLSLKVFLIK